MDAGKSPLALLMKTCEVIGLPDTTTTTATVVPSSTIMSTAMKKSSSVSSSSDTAKHKDNHHHHHDSKKDTTGGGDIKSKLKEDSKSPHHRPLVDENGNKSAKDHHHHHHHHHYNPTSTSCTTTSTDSAPSTSTPATTATTTTTASSLSSNYAAMMAASARCIPQLGAYPMSPYGYPTFAPQLLGYPPQLSPYSYANPFNIRCPDPMCKTCPATSTTANAGRPTSCVTPGCTQCPSGGTTTASSSSVDLAAASFWLSYQQSLFAHSMQQPAFFPPAPLPPVTTSATATLHNFVNKQHTCNWVVEHQGSVVCGKHFASAEDLMVHMKTHAGGTDTTTTTKSPTRSISPRTNASMYLNAFRFHPYGGGGTKFGAPMPPFGAASSTPAGGAISPNSYSQALTHLYNQQRLMQQHP
jgi:hypothetical protein